MSDEIWQDDLLGRRAEADLIIDFLSKRAAERRAAGKLGAYVLNLNAGWGLGKTFFLERLNEELGERGFISTYVNAWRDDTAGEPLITVVSAIDEALSPYYSADPNLERAWQAVRIAGAEAIVAVLKGGAKRLAQKFVGEGVEEALAAIEAGSDAAAAAERHEIATSLGDIAGSEVASVLNGMLSKRIAEYKRRLTSTEAFKAKTASFLERLAESEVSAPMFVLIDELDRCRPTYAIEMLEQVKHLFDISGIVFVIATDSDQLAHSIKAVYGAGFDGPRYLNRFFHRHYLFRQTSFSNFIEALLKSSGMDLSKLSTPNDDVLAFLTSASNYFRLKLRDVEQCIDILHSVVTVWPHSIKIELLALFPIIVGFQGSDDWILEQMTRRPTKITLRERFGTWVLPASRQGLPAIDIINLISQLAVRTAEPLHKIHEVTYPEDIHGRQLHTALSNEFGALHGNSYNANAPHYSIILKYPEFVRSLAGFTS